MVLFHVPHHRFCKIPVFTAVVAGLMKKIPRGVLKSNCRETESGKGHESKGRVCGPHLQ